MRRLFVGARYEVSEEDLRRVVLVHGRSPTREQVAAELQEPSEPAKVTAVIRILSEEWVIPLDP